MTKQEHVRLWALAQNYVDFAQEELTPAMMAQARRFAMKHGWYEPHAQPANENKPAAR